MKVIIKPNKNDTITSKDYHSNGNSLVEMLKTTNQNIKKSVQIEKEDDYIKTFNQSISKTLSRKYYQN